MAGARQPHFARDRGSARRRRRSRTSRYPTGTRKWLIEMAQHRGGIGGESGKRVQHRADHRHHDRRRRAVARHVGDHDAERPSSPRRARRSSRRRRDGWSGSAPRTCTPGPWAASAAAAAAACAPRSPAPCSADRGCRRTSRSRCWRVRCVRHARQHFFGLDRLGDVVHGAELEPETLSDTRRAPTGRSPSCRRSAGSP